MRPARPESLPGVTGTLVSGYFATRRLEADHAGQLGESSRQAGRRAIAEWNRRQGARLGPASSLDALVRNGTRPVLAALGFEFRETGCGRPGRRLVGQASSPDIDLPVLVVPWGDNLDRHWTSVAAAAHGHHEWVIGFNGRAIRLCDAREAWARRYLEVDLETVATAPASFGVFWALVRPAALAGLTRRLVNESAKLGVAVCSSLRDGVREALTLLLAALAASCRLDRRGPGSGLRADDLFDQALTIIYRVLFLLFAESRALVPVWHPVYRASYTIEALRMQAEAPGWPAGIWEALQALSRLAHAGCRAGTLAVTPFNGRLFAPARAPLADRLRLDDSLVAQAILALTTRRSSRGREPISFRDLGVEQLGAVYESVLDYEPRLIVRGRDASQRKARERMHVDLVEGRGRRKASGTFYTPQSMTDEVVRRALAPLVAGRSPDDILALRVLDPAMGSGAFLVSACRFLASAYEDAVVRRRGRLAADITEADRAEYRRLVARHCLYGVDLNPMAVQVARLSLWLATLAADRPLTFLDHHLAVGDSLVGVSLDDLARQPPGGHRAGKASKALPLFDAGPPDTVLARVLPDRLRLEAADDDTIDAVRDKERVVARLGSATSPTAALKRAADLWCASWFWDGDEGTAPDAREYADLAAAVTGARPSLPAGIVQARLDSAQRIAAGRRFFHWTLEFPEVFYGRGGEPLPAGGFDAVVGNPPWEMLRGDLGTRQERVDSRQSAARLTRFARESGVYPSCARGHVNQFQLFVERSLDLVRVGGRVGLIVPWGLASDHGCAEIRRRLFDRCTTDRLAGFDNAAGIFPIHRGIRFLLLSTTRGGSTRRLRCQFGLRDPAALAASYGSRGRTVARARPVVLSRETLARVSGPDLAVPHVRTAAELELLERLASRFPALADAGGWNVSFGRELNATDDREWFTTDPGSVPVIDGKHVEPFVAHIESCRRWIRDPARFAGTRCGQAAASARLAYRDVAASTNRLTLIAAVLPPRTAAVHTLFCLKTPLSLARQRLLCALLNSLVANVVVRMWVTTHLGTTTVERLPAPAPGTLPAVCARLARLAGRLERPGQAFGPAYVELQALVMRWYELSGPEVTLVLESFPLLDGALRASIRQAWEAVG